MNKIKKKKKKMDYIYIKCQNYIIKCFNINIYNTNI